MTNQNELVLSILKDLETYKSLANKSASEIRKFSKQKGIHYSTASCKEVNLGYIYHSMKIGARIASLAQAPEQSEATPVPTKEQDVQEIISFLKYQVESFKELLEKANSTSQYKEIIIENKISGTKTVIDKQHYKFELLLKVMTTKCNGKRLFPALVGPAGSGKSTIFSKIGECLGVRSCAISFNMMSSPSQIFGYTDINSNFVKTPFYEYSKNGGVLVFDEFDGWHPGLAISLNNALANGCYTFPNGETVTFHKDFYCGFTMNTWGNGANAEFVGRNQLDGATLDRLVLIDFQIDTDLEAALAGIELPSTNNFDVSSGGKCTKENWFKLVLKIRDYINTNKIKHIVSPRATFTGISLLESGIGFNHVLDMVILKNLDSQTKILLKNLI